MSIQAMKQALEALEGLAHDSTGKTGTQMMRDMDNAITTLRAAITEAERQEPVAETHPNNLRKTVGGDHWCREVLLYSGNSPHDFFDGKNYRVKLYTTPQPAIPAGYALVPVEPTPKMVDATWDEPLGANESHNARNKRIYKAMIAAAPKPEELK